MSDSAKMRLWLVDCVEPAVSRTLDRLSCAPDVVRVAVMPDVHLAAGVSNGVVLATNRMVYPAAVGGDIGCGYAIQGFLGSADPLRGREIAAHLLDSLSCRVPVLRHRRRSGLPELGEALDPHALSHPALLARALSVGREELGTLGRGNHFLEFQQDDEGRLWVMVHSGSRAMGQHIMAAHVQHAQVVGGGLACLDTDADEGQAYLNDVSWARRYASESRCRMLSEATAIIESILGLKPDPDAWLNTDHNHVQREAHGGSMVLVHRKGANVASSGTPNVIPGSMATHTYHVEGRGEPSSLASSSHGAGRRLSRGAARAKVRRKDLARQLANVWVDPRTLGKLADESPAAYKDLDAVMRAQRGLVRIVRRVRPLVCYKGV